MYSLCNFFIVDIENRELWIANTSDFYGFRTAEYEKKKITKATINKHIKDRGFVISHAIIENFAPEYYHDTTNQFIGEFEDMESILNYFKDLYNKTLDIRKGFHFVNFGSTLLDVINSLNRGQTLEEFNKYNNKFEDEIALFKCLKEI